MKRLLVLAVVLVLLTLLVSSVMAGDIIIEPPTIPYTANSQVSTEQKVREAYPPLSDAAPGGVQPTDQISVNF